MKDKKQRENERQVPEKEMFENDAKFMTSEEEKLRIQVVKQEELINELRDRVSHLKGNEGSGNLEAVGLEVQLQNAEARAEAAQKQLEMQSLTHAREISQLKQQLLQKESIIDTLQGRQQFFELPKQQVSNSVPNF